MRVVVHYHRPGHKTQDITASLATLYDDLAARMARAARDLLARTKDWMPAVLPHKPTQFQTLDDNTVGHQFHGNQHTGGIKGPHKPTTHSQKSSKAAIHELLSSGHPFTKEELMQIAGVKTDKLFADYMAMLKNPKYAGPKGSLTIEKGSQGYFVAMPDGSPAPPLEAPLPPPVVHAPPAPPPVPVAQPVEEAVGFEKHMNKMLGAQPGSVLKSQADQYYSDSIDAAFADMKSELQAGGKHHAAVLKFKDRKTAAMGAWAQAVHGTPFKVKPNSVFNADAQLAKDTAMGMAQDEALAKWKHNTNLEKQGLFPPSAVPVKKYEEKPVDIVTDMGSPADVAEVDYGGLVPKSHKPISSDDIINGTYTTGVKQFGTLLVSNSIGIQENKERIEKALRARLKDKPNFQALVKRLGLNKSGLGSLEAKLISAWAGSSGDTRDISVAQQIAVKDAFGIPDDHVEKAALQSLKNHGNNEDKVISAGIHQLNSNMTPLKPSEIPVARAALKEFVLAQYEETQEFMKKNKLDHVFIARGMEMPVTSKNKAGAAALKLQPASSFSTDYTTAKSFAGSNGTIFLSKVPREQVLSTYLTGYGCTGEHEVVVIAHDKLKAYTIPKHATYSHEGAVQQIAKEIQGA